MGKKIFLQSLLMVFFAWVQPLKAQNEQSIIKNYASYNTWANLQYAKWLKDISNEILHKEVESSFNSLYKTIVHLWNAEYGWLQTLEGKPWGNMPSESFNGNCEELFNAFLETSKAFESHVNKLSEQDLEKLFDLSKSKVKGEEIMLHVFNHASYHRGQLITLGRQLGVENPPRADYIYFISLLE